MTVKFKDDYLRKLYSNELVKGKPLYNKSVIEKFQDRVLLMEQIKSTKQLREFKSLRFEALLGSKKGLFSVRINKQYRLEFMIDNDSIQLEEIILIEKLSNHYE